ncbi:hypothetical protein GGF50DRAFT_50732 [Schizophyllum commune]
MLQVAASRSNLAFLRAGVTPDIACIRADLSAIDHGYARIEAQLDILVVQLARVMGQRADVERQRAVSIAMLSPVRRLPVEILSKIFELSLPYDWEQKFLGSRGPMFAEVCKVWRTVAIGMPRLWNTIGIDYRTASKYVRNAFNLCMARCGQGPLRLRLAFHCQWARCHLIPEVWTTLCSQSHRWSALTVEDLYPRTARELHWTWPSRFLILSRLELVGDCSVSPPLQIFSDAPVTSLKLQYGFHLREHLALPSTWKITNLEINCRNDLRSFLPLLWDCRLSLQHLDVGTVANAEDFPASVVDGIMLPVLGSAKLHGDACRFLTYMEIPRLRLLDLCGPCEGGIICMNKPLKEVAERIYTSRGWESLRWLTLTDLTNATGAVIQCLDHLPTLQSLDIENRAAHDWGEHKHISKTLLRALVRVPTNAASMKRLPRLRRLGLLWRMAEGKACDTVYLVEALLRSRSTEDTYEGENLGRIEWFATDLPGDWSVSGLIKTYFYDVHAPRHSLETQMLFV